MSEDKRNYCEDCDWEKHQWFTREYPKCSHPAFREGMAYTHRQNDVERYPYCSYINSHGRCVHYVKKKNIASNIRIIWETLWGKRPK